MTDEEIVRLVQKGKKDEFGEIIDRYQRKLHYYLKGMVNQNDEVVEDLVQETLIKAYENIQGFDCKKKFSSWIYRIAHNRAIDYFRKVKEKRMEDWQEEMIEDGNKLLEEVEIKKEERKELMKAIKSLETKYREVIWLYYFEDKSYDEMSDILETSVSNIGVMMNRGKRKLKKIYDL